LKGLWLGIDTVFSAGAVAVVRVETIEALQVLPDRRPTSEGLLPAVKQCLEKAGSKGEDLEGIAFTAGPGSYTGLRIATATVWGLSMGWGVPLKGVPTLRLLAFGTGSLKPVLSVTRARRGEVFAALFASFDPFSMELIPSGVYSSADLAARARTHSPVAVGSGRDELPNSGLDWLPDQYDNPGPGACAILGRSMAMGRGFDSAPSPLYLRGFMEKAGNLDA